MIGIQVCKKTPDSRVTMTEISKNAHGVKGGVAWVQVAAQMDGRGAAAVRIRSSTHVHSIV